MLRFWDKILLPLKTTLHNLQSYVFPDFAIVNSFTLTKQTAISLGWFSAHVYIYVYVYRNWINIDRYSRSLWIHHWFE
jgi:hypothetical protein